jgi:hypothetical protein
MLKRNSLKSLTAATRPASSLNIILGRKRRMAEQKISSALLNRATQESILRKGSLAFLTPHELRGLYMSGKVQNSIPENKRLSALQNVRSMRGQR